MMSVEVPASITEPTEDNFSIIRRKFRVLLSSLNDELTESKELLNKEIEKAKIPGRRRRMEYFQLLVQSIKIYNFYVETIILNLQRRNFVNLELKSALQEAIPSIIAHLDVMTNFLSPQNAKMPLYIDTQIERTQGSENIPTEPSYIIDKLFYGKQLGEEITEQDVNSRGINLYLFDQTLPTGQNSSTLYNSQITTTLDGRIGDPQSIRISLHQHTGEGREQTTIGTGVISFRIEREHRPGRREGDLNLDVDIIPLQRFDNDREMLEIYFSARSDFTHHWRLSEAFQGMGYINAREIFRNFLEEMKMYFDFRKD